MVAESLAYEGQSRNAEETLGFCDAVFEAVVTDTGPTSAGYC